METATLTADECTWPGTTAEGLASLRPVIDGGVLTAGNASRRSDRAAACVVVDATEVERRGIDPLALYRGLTGLGCEPYEMGNGPVFAVPRPHDRLGLSIDDIDLWEHNEAFVVQVAYAVTGSGTARTAERERRRDRCGPSLRNVRDATYVSSSDRGTRRGAKHV